MLYVLSSYIKEVYDICSMMLLQIYHIPYIILLLCYNIYDICVCFNNTHILYDICK